MPLLRVVESQEDSRAFGDTRGTKILALIWHMVLMPISEGGVSTLGAAAAVVVPCSGRRADVLGLIAIVDFARRCRR